MAFSACMCLRAVSLSNAIVFSTSRRVLDCSSSNACLAARKNLGSKESVEALKTSAQWRTVCVAAVLVAEQESDRTEPMLWRGPRSQVQERRCRIRPLSSTAPLVVVLNSRLYSGRGSMTDVGPEQYATYSRPSSTPPRLKVTVEVRPLVLSPQAPVKTPASPPSPSCKSALTSVDNLG